MDLTIVTYGGGEILQHVFNAIAKLFYGNDTSIVRPLIIICSMIGGFWAMCHAAFSSSINPMLSKFFLPVLIAGSVFMIPSTSVHIEDVLKDKSYNVDHVPLLLAKFSEMVSSIGYQTTVAIETVMHVPNDTSYNSTGMLFGAETALDMSKYKITNASLEQNLKRFSKQCVLYDLALGRYSIDELKKSTDLWSLFEAKTSNVRMISYCEPSSKGKCEYLSCKAAIEKMKPLFNKEKGYYAKSDILGNLPLSFQALTKISGDKETMIGQELVMNLLSDEYGGSDFAKKRAYAQQQNTFQIIGSLASSSLISMRAVFEALIYVTFIFVFPFSVLPGGMKLISQWCSLLVWIQLWPPLYAVLSYFIQISSHMHVETIFAGLAADQKSLSFFTNMGLEQLQSNIMAASGYLYSSVPFLSYMILKGGMQAFASVAGSLMAPMQNAASSAATEQSTGNYSYGNTSFGQTSFQNTTGFQTNTAPTISSGYLTDHQGSSTAIYSNGENILKQSNSDLRTGLYSDEVISEGLHRNEQQARSLTESSQKTYLESLSNHGRATADLTEHFANSNNYSEGLSDRDSYGIQESAAFVQNVAENWGKQFGFNAKESMEYLASASVGAGGSFFSLLSASAQASSSYNFGASRDEIVNSAMAVANSESFQTNLQKINDFAESKNFNSSQDEGARFATSYNNSLDEMKSSQESYQSSLSTLNQISDSASWAKQNSQSVKQSLNQDFINWAQNKYEGAGEFSKVSEIFSKGNEEMQENLMVEFVQELVHSKTSIQSPINPEKQNFQNAYEQSNVKKLDHDLEFEQLSNKTINAFQERGSEAYGLHKWNLKDKEEELKNKQAHSQNTYQNESNRVSEKIDSKNEEVIGKFDQKNQEYLFKRAWKGPSKKDNLSQEYRIEDKPFWMGEEE